MRKYALIVFLVYGIWSSDLFGQTDTISGVVNSYTHVSSLDAATSLMTVDDASAFSSDDRVLLIQMRGANVSRLSNNTYGNINSLDGAGSYMFGRVCNVSTGTNEISLQESVDPSFATSNFDSAGIQLIRIPFYTGDVFVNGILTADPWDGQKGGVLAIDVAGKVILGADLIVDALGFRGGNPTSPGGSCVSFVSLSGEAYSWASQNGGGKGEGITSFVASEETGKAPLANGGGGGNNHNAGGAGGANYGAGGTGGLRVSGFLSCYGDDPGRAGNSLSAFGYSLTNQRIYLGGGGGAGHSNNIGEGQAGGNGAGIIIVTADEIEGNGFGIYARGEDALDSGSDGGSGGGAGGAIILEVNTLTPPFSLNVKGGDGGDTGIAQCQGPGGGGGGGVIWSSVITPVGVSLNGNGGQPGTATVSGCGGNQGASTGGAGIVGSGYIRPSATGTACVLPAFWRGMEAISVENGIAIQGELVATDATAYVLEVRKRVDESWQTATYLDVESRSDGKLFPKWFDKRPLIGKQAYQMVLIDVDGKEIPSPIVEAIWGAKDQFKWESLSWIENQLEVWMENPAEAIINWEIFDMQGRLIWQKNQQLPAFRGRKIFVLPKVGRGAYLIKASRQGKSAYKKVLK